MKAVVCTGVSAMESVFVMLNRFFYWQGVCVVLKKENSVFLIL